jgi:hypothetical protein
MALWNDPEAWSTEFLRSQKFNSQVRDKQQFLFKRPREVVKIDSGANLTIPTTMSFIDELLFSATIETTGRPVMVTIIGASLFTSASANGVIRFDCKVGRLFASGLGTETQLSQGAHYVTIPNASNISQVVGFEANMLLDWLTTPDVYLIKPMWFATTGNVVPVSTVPLVLMVEEL